MSRTNAILASAMVVAIGACGGSPGDLQEITREAVGKADIVLNPNLSCRSYCGSLVFDSSGYCACDDICAMLGDCCNDKQSECDSTDAGPPDAADGGAPDTGGQKCQDNADCSEGEYCAFEPGECLLPTFDIMTGQCSKRPEACYYLWDPVCGCDGKTYSNDCMAASAGVSIGHQGECQPAKCGPFPGGACAAGQVCNIESCAPGASGTCVPQPEACYYLWDPVCGCDGQTYSNDCHRLMAGAARSHEGVCESSCFGAWVDQFGNCRGPADGVLPDECCEEEKQQLCGAIDAEYAQAVDAAKECHPLVFAPQCTYLVLTSLSCGCPTYVNQLPSAAHAAKWSQLRCNELYWMCPAIACPLPTSGTCDVQSERCLNNY